MLAPAPPRVDILIGDVFTELLFMPSDHFDCIVTSPPYWGLRDYGVEGQLGLEPTLEEYLSNLTTVFREARRTLKPTGTMWLVVGDSYAANRSYQVSDSKHKAHDFKTSGAQRAPDGIRPKNLLMIPNRLALALQADGWLVRSEIIWHKTNPMPESVGDRPTCAHEKIWLLAKSEKYFYDANAIKEPVVKGYAGSSFTAGKTGIHQLGRASRKPRRGDKQQRIADSSNPSTARWNAAEDGGAVMEMRNARNVWTIDCSPYPEAHFATFPPALVERCLLAGCPHGGQTLDPFGGAGTTGLVARRLRMSATLIELNPDYAALARARIDRD